MDKIEQAIASGQISISYNISISEGYFFEKYPDWATYNSKVKDELRQKTIDLIVSQLPTLKNFF